MRCWSGCREGASLWNCAVYAHRLALACSAICLIHAVPAHALTKQMTCSPTHACASQHQLFLLTHNQLTAVSSAAASNWLSCRLQLLAAALTLVVAVLAAAQRDGWLSAVSPQGAGAGGAAGGAHNAWGDALPGGGNGCGSLVGLSLAYCLPM